MLYRQQERTWLEVLGTAMSKSEVCQHRAKVTMPSSDLEGQGSVCETEGQQEASLDTSLTPMIVEFIHSGRHNPHCLSLF